MEAQETRAQKTEAQEARAEETEAQPPGLEKLEAQDREVQEPDVQAEPGSPKIRVEESAFQTVRIQKTGVRPWHVRWEGLGLHD